MMQSNLVKNAIRALLMFALFAILTGIIYPLAVTGISRVAFPGKSQGSLIGNQGATVGSELIGQSFISAGYFHGRPSAAGAEGYDASASSGSNLGPTNAKLIETVDENAKALRAENGLPENSQVPSDLVTASASGLDPHISQEAAYLQAPRVAAERNLTEAQVKSIIDRNVEDRLLGVFGEPRVNVLKLNLDLDSL